MMILMNRSFWQYIALAPEFHFNVVLREESIEGLHRFKLNQLDV